MSESARKGLLSDSTKTDLEGSVSNATRVVIWLHIVLTSTNPAKYVKSTVISQKKVEKIPRVRWTTPKTDDQSLAKTRLKKQKLPRLMSLSTWFSKAYGCTLVNVEVLVLRNILVPRTNLRDIGPA